MIPSHIERCQGRMCSSTLGPTLAEECTDCARRTCIEPGVTYRWMYPPPIFWWQGRICGAWLPEWTEYIEVGVTP